MDHNEIISAITFIRPNAQFVLRGEDLEWLDEEQTEPTKKEIQTGFNDFKAAQKAQAEAKAQAKAQAEAKLAKLGLTTEDLRALGL